MVVLRWTSDQLRTAAGPPQSRAVPPQPLQPTPLPPRSGAVCCAPVCFFPRPICSLSRSGRAQPPVPFRKLFIAPCWGGCDSLPCPHPMAASPHIPHRGQRAPGRPHCVPWVNAQCTEGQVGAVGMPAAPSPPFPSAVPQFPRSSSLGSGAPPQPSARPHCAPLSCGATRGQILLPVPPQVPPLPVPME